MRKVSFTLLCTLVAPSLQFFSLFDENQPIAPSNKVCEWFGSAPVCRYSKCPLNWTLITQMDKTDSSTRYGYYGNGGCAYGYKRLCCDDRVVKKVPSKHCRDHIHIYELDGNEISCPAGSFTVASENTNILLGEPITPASLTRLAHIICCDDGTLVMSEEERIQTVKVV